MIRAQIIAQPECANRVIDLLADDETVTNIVRFPGAAHRPDGDVILCDIAREEASAVVHSLKRTGVLDHGAISLSETIAELSKGGQRAVTVAKGPESDAVIWELVDERISADADLSGTFVGLIAVAVMIGCMALLEQSQILMVGAMVVGPEFAPLAGIVVGLTRGRFGLVMRSQRTLTVGVLASVALGTLLVGGLRVVGIAPVDYWPTGTALGSLVGMPDWFVLIVAVLAGVAGILAMTTSHAGALVGVLISVATVPALAGIATALAYLDWLAAGQATLQFVANVAGIVGAGIATLAFQRRSFANRYRRHWMTGPAASREHAVRSAVAAADAHRYDAPAAAPPATTAEPRLPGVRSTPGRDLELRQPRGPHAPEPDPAFGTLR